MRLLNLESPFTAGTRRTLILDPQLAGISGDMLLGSLIDLGVDPQSMRVAIRKVSKHLKGCKLVDLRVKEVRRGEFRAKRAEIIVEERYNKRTGSELLQALEAVMKDIGIGRFYHQLAVNSLRTLVEAEANLHGELPGELGLDEAGSADTLADLIGIVSALKDLGIDKGSEVYSLPIAVGGGLFKFSHGTVQAPAPAVIEIASTHHLPIIGGPAEVELATPTGLSILANLATRTGPVYPSFTPERVGYGAGIRDFSEFPNVFRAVLGERATDGNREEVTVLETTLDDVTGETLGFIMERLLGEGALDVQVIPTVGKKNRPSHILRVISKLERAEKLNEVIFEESGTLGVRSYQVMREVASRRILTVGFKIDGKTLRARIKVSRDSKGKVIKVKPEYDDIAALASRFHIPLRRLFDAAVSEAKKKLNLL